jgi:hypothetical protein
MPFSLFDDTDASQISIFRTSVVFLVVNFTLPEHTLRSSHVHHLMKFTLRIQLSHAYIAPISTIFKLILQRMKCSNAWGKVDMLDNYDRFVTPGSS